VKSRGSPLAPAHPGGPGERAVKQLWCGGGGLQADNLFLKPMICCYCSYVGEFGCEMSSVMCWFTLMVTVMLD